MWLLLSDLFFFIALVYLLSYWKKNDELTEFGFSFYLAAFWSLTALIAVLSFNKLTWENIAIGSSIALFQFFVSYFVSSWFYRRFYK